MDFEQFTLDEKTVDAVARNFEIIGEAANRLPDDSKREIPISNGIEYEAFATGSFTTTSGSTMRSFGR